MLAAVLLLHQWVYSVTWYIDHVLQCLYLMVRYSVCWRDCLKNSWDKAQKRMAIPQCQRFIILTHSHKRTDACTDARTDTHTHVHAHTVSYSSALLTSWCRLTKPNHSHAASGNLERIRDPGDSSVQHKTCHTHNHLLPQIAKEAWLCVCVCVCVCGCVWVRLSHVVSATETALSLTELSVIWRCWQVALLRDVCDHNKVVRLVHIHTHCGMHSRTGRDVTDWESQRQCGILSTSIMQRIWQLEESNSPRRLPPPSLFLPLSLALSPSLLTSPSLVLHSPIHLCSLRYPLLCYGMKTERELESRQQEQQSNCEQLCWMVSKVTEQHIWPYGIKTHLNPWNGYECSYVTTVCVYSKCIFVWAVSCRHIVQSFSWLVESAT